MIKWDVGSISAEFVLWMTDDDALPGSTSLVGILSFSAFESMISKFVDRSLSRNVRLLVELTSILYSHGSQGSYAACDATSLWNLCSLVGTRVLQGLESALGNASLAAASLEKLKALFLVQFATIIAVGYWQPRSPLGDPGVSTSALPAHQPPTSAESCTPGPSAQVLSEAQDNLLRILTHHMVYIAERINLLDPTVSRKRIIEDSARRWNRRPTFQWETMPAPEGPDGQSDSASSGHTRDRPRGTACPARSHYLSRSHAPTSSCRPAGVFGTCVHEQSLNADPSPTDRILARRQQPPSSPHDARAPTDRASTPRPDVENARAAPRPTRRCPAAPLPGMSARDRDVAAFDRLAATDGMCAPFLSADRDDGHADANDAPSADAAPRPSAPQSSTRPLPTTCGAPPPHPTNTIAPYPAPHRSVCRACHLATLPFDTLGPDGLCQFCAAMPGHGTALAADDALGDGVLDQGQRGWGERGCGGVNLVV